jgi:hypothetical protein
MGKKSRRKQVREDVPQWQIDMVKEIQRAKCAAFGCHPEFLSDKPVEGEVGLFRVYHDHWCGAVGGKGQ